MTSTPCPTCGYDRDHPVHADRAISEFGPEGPDAYIDGQPVARDLAIQAAVALLRGAARPLVGGLEDLDLNGQAAAWRLADQLGAAIDTNWSDEGRGETLTLQQYGEVTASWGEVRQRSDLLVVWFADPAADHPCFWQLLHRDPPADRRVVVIDETTTETAAAADQFLQVSRAEGLQALTCLRAAISDAITPAGPTGGPNWRELADQMMSARYGCLLTGRSPIRSDLDAVTESCLLLTRDLNQHTRFVTTPLPHGFNPTGAQYVLGGLTGFPFAVDLSAGHPRFDPFEFSAHRLLDQHRCDAVLAISGAADENTRFLVRHADFLRTVPLVQLMTAPSDAPLPAADVALRIDARGDIMRADGAIIRLGIPCPERSATVCLDRIRTGLAAV